MSTTHREKGLRYYVDNYMDIGVFVVVTVIVLLWISKVKAQDNLPKEMVTTEKTVLLDYSTTAGGWRIPDKFYSNVKLYVNGLRQSPREFTIDKGGILRPNFSQLKIDSKILVDYRTVN